MLDIDGFRFHTEGAFRCNCWENLVQDERLVVWTINIVGLGFDCPSRPVSQSPLCSNIINTLPNTDFSIPICLCIWIISGSCHSSQKHDPRNVAFVTND